MRNEKLSRIRNVSLSTLVLSLLLLGSPAAEKRPDYSAVLSKDPFLPKETRQFTCKDSVNILFEWKNLREGSHTLTVVWHNAQGEEAEELRLNFISSKGGKVENWATLKFENLHRKKSIFGFDAADSAIVGNWEAKIFLDGDFIENKTFTVTCD